MKDKDKKNIMLSFARSQEAIVLEAKALVADWPNETLNPLLLICGNLYPEGRMLNSFWVKMAWI